MRDWQHQDREEEAERNGDEEELEENKIINTYTLSRKALDR